MASRSRSCLATIVGWTIVALLLVWGFGLVVGWIRFVVRAFGWLLLLVVLLVVYLRLKSGGDRDPER